ncbi:MAG: DNA-processing protein DprA, partial [bacterium]|nr:DNA-processing protein DprA [bacterium]
KGSALKKGEKVLKDCENAGVNTVFYTNKLYPVRLKQLADAPPLLYTKGNCDLNPDKSVGIVGTRKATNYGKQVTEDIVSDLNKHNPSIISGLAYGIDIAAHKASLEQVLPTIGVLAGGLDKIYPAIHKSTAEKMLEMGGIISENPPGTKPDAHLFPARNRIIAGLSDALVVVEAAAKGGALITAEIAYSYERPLFAVPGNIGNKYSEGCNKLIRNNKANIYSEIAALEYLMGWDAENPAVQKPSMDISEFDQSEQPLLQLLQNSEDGMLIDELAWKSQTSINQTASLLLGLEFKGVVKLLPGKRYSLKY